MSLLIQIESSKLTRQILAQLNGSIKSFLPNPRLNQSVFMPIATSQNLPKWSTPQFSNQSGEEQRNQMTQLSKQLQLLQDSKQEQQLCDLQQLQSQISGTQSQQVLLHDSSQQPSVLAQSKISVKECVETTKRNFLDQLATTRASKKRPRY